MLRDEDIDQDLPSCVEDEGLSSGFIRVAGEREMCVMRGAVSQIKYVPSFILLLTTGV